MISYLEEDVMKNKSWLVFLSIIILVWTGLKPNEAFAEADIDRGKIDRFIQSEMEKNNIPGMALAIVHDNQTIYEKGFGKTSNGQSVTPSTPFAIASLSKSITALAVMQLVESGKVKLDSPVTDYISIFKLNDPNVEKITVRHLLNQTSGLADSVFPEMAFRKQSDSLEDSIARMKTVKLLSYPGQKFHYHNPNYQILALLVEEVSGESFPNYLQKHIFQPLQMNDTYEVSNTTQFSTFDNFSNGHIFLYGKPVSFKEPAWFIEGDAGNVSTIEDMAKWLKMQLNGVTNEGKQLLSNDGIEQMHSAPTGTGSSYGMGWTVDGQKLSHNGLLWTYYAEQVLIPKSDYGIVVLFNSGLNSFVNYGSITNGVTDILAGKDAEESLVNGQNLEFLFGILTVITVAIGIRSFRRINVSEKKFRKTSKWLFWFKNLLSLIPVVLLIFLPNIVSFISGGRVLNWERIILIMPSIFIWLLISAVFSLVIVMGTVLVLPKEHKNRP